VISSNRGILYSLPTLYLSCNALPGLAIVAVLVLLDFLTFAMNSIQTASRPEWSDSVNGDSAATNEHADQDEYPPAKVGSTSSSGPHPIRSALGLHEKPPVHEDHEDHIHHQLLWSRIRLTLREPFAEFWGTAIMVFFGNGSVAQVLLSVGNKAAPGANGYGAYQSISWGYVAVQAVLTDDS
jgi:hypothetical protein